jgi:Flp pilus assembly protein TadD
MEFNESRSVLGVAEQVLAGSIASARGDHEKATRDLRAAVGLEDALTYGEPPEWTVPVRAELGAALLAAGRAAEAEQSFRQDLERFPSNGWSLFGLAQSLRTQGKSADAERAMADFRRAWAEADFEIEASPY